MKHYIQILLAIFTLKPTVKCLLYENPVDDKFCLPNDWLEKEVLIQDGANKLFTDITTIDSSWVQLKNIGTFDNVSVLEGIKVVGIVFGGVLQEEIKLSKDYFKWIELKELFSNNNVHINHLDLIQIALRKLP
jgi:hypothetical protein